VKALRRIWEDVRQGENIDLYVTVCVAIILAVLNATGLGGQAWVAPLTLAVLGLLAVATLGNRYKVERVLDELARGTEEFFQEGYPPSFGEHIEHAEELWIQGVTLSRTILTHYALFERKLRHGNRIRVLVVRPGGAGAEMIAMRDYVLRNTARISGHIEDTLSDLCRLKEIAPDALEIRVLDYPSGFGGFAMDPGTATGVLYLEHYPFKSPGGSMPKYVLCAQDGRWYDFFRAEMQSMWDRADPWDCAEA
jgi:hypothetical protein